MGLHDMCGDGRLYASDDDGLHLVQVRAPQEPALLARLWLQYE